MSRVPCRVISSPQSIHGFGKSMRDCSALSPNWRDDLSWLSGWFFHSECSSVCNAHWIGLMVNHDVRLLINYHDSPSYYTA